MPVHIYYGGIMGTPHSTPTEAAISERAQRIWASAGQIEGQDVNYWLQAEKELRDEAAAPQRETRPVDTGRSRSEGGFITLPAKSAEPVENGRYSPTGVVRERSKAYVTF
jgi:hypothetical protein